MLRLLHGSGRLTRRQAVGVGVVATLAAAVMVASIAGQQGLATALLGLLVMSVFAGVVQLRRRVGETERWARRASGDVRTLANTHARVAERLEAGQHRVLAMVERERLTASERHQKSQAAMRTAVDASTRRLARAQWGQAREMEALFQLFRGFEPRAPMPPSGGWALDPTDLLQLLFLISQERPKTILELGSGTSTVWMAYTIETLGGKLVSVDHEHMFAERTRRLLDAHGLADVAEVREASLAPITIDDKEYQWYETRVFEDLGNIDLLVVDGPPAKVGPIARYPALDVLETRLSAAATIVLDDIDRSDEQEVVRRWTESVPELARLDEIVGQQAVLSYRRPVGRDLD